MTWKIYKYIFLGLLIRIFILGSFKINKYLSKRVEISTSVNSWKRAVEGVHLIDLEISPYSGDIFHEDLISLHFYRILIKTFHCYVPTVFAFIDVTTGALFYLGSIKQLKKTKKLIEKQLDSIDNQKLNEQFSLTEEKIYQKSRNVLLAYLFSPISIIACCGIPTTIILNFLIACMFMMPNVTSNAIVSAMIAFKDIHYISLAITAFVSMDNRKLKFAKVFFGSLFILFMASILMTGKSMQSTLEFINETVLFRLGAGDYTPNIGMFWYFYTEMFDTFLPFFTGIIQINSFIHIVPLAMTLKSSPHFALFVTLFATSVFQPYQNLASFSVLINLLPMYSELFLYMKKSLVVAVTLVFSICLWPIFWHMWIEAQTGNSNFYFGVTLSFTTALIILMADLLTASTHVSLKIQHSIKDVDARGCGSGICSG